MATTDEKDRKIGEVPHLENVTGREKIPVSAEGEPAYIEVEQIKEGLQPSGNYLTQEQADKRYAKVGDIPNVSGFVTEAQVDEKLKKVGGVTWGKIVAPNIHIKGEFVTGTAESDRYVWINGEQIFLDEEFDYKSDEIIKAGPSSGTWFGRAILELSFLCDTSLVSDMKSMFNGCNKLVSLNLGDKFDTSQVENMSYMFFYCKALTALDLGDRFDTSQVTNMEFMFNGCDTLTALNLGDKFDIGQVTDMSYMFQNCNKLTTVTGVISNIKFSLNLSYCPLTSDSAMVFINGLSNEVKSKEIIFSSTTYDSLSLEQIAVGTSKGWKIIRG